MPSRVALISISCPGDPATLDPVRWPHVLRLEFDDIDQATYDAVSAETPAGHTASSGVKTMSRTLRQCVIFTDPG